MLIRFFILTFLLSATLSTAQSKLVEDLKEEDKIETSYHLYPSTLRMLNLENDPAFDDLIRPLKKLSIYSLRPDGYTTAELQSSFQSLLENGFDEYIQVNGDSISMYVAGNERKGKTCILAKAQSEFFLVNMEGMINVLKLGEVYESFANRDSSSVGLGMLVDYIVDDKDDRRRRAKRHKERMEKNSKDSIQVTIGDDEKVEPKDSLKAKEEKAAKEENE